MNRPRILKDQQIRPSKELIEVARDFVDNELYKVIEKNFITKKDADPETKISGIVFIDIVRNVSRGLYPKVFDGITPRRLNSSWSDSIGKNYSNDAVNLLTDKKIPEVIKNTLESLDDREIKAQQLQRVLDHPIHDLLAEYAKKDLTRKSCYVLSWA